MRLALIKMLFLLCLLVAAPAAMASDPTAVTTHTIDNADPTAPGGLYPVMAGAKVGDTILVGSDIGVINLGQVPDPHIGVMTLTLKGRSPGFDFGPFFAGMMDEAIFSGLLKGQTPSTSLLAAKLARAYGSMNNYTAIELNGKRLLDGSIAGGAFGLNLSDFVIRGVDKKDTIYLPDGVGGSLVRDMRSDRSVSLGNMSNMLFMDFAVSAGSVTRMSGIFGAYADGAGHAASIGQLDGLGVYKLSVSNLGAGGQIYGGVAGVLSKDGAANFGGLKNSMFFDIENRADVIYGGVLAVVGAAPSTLGAIENSVFANIVNEATNGIEGGALALDPNDIGVDIEIKNSIFTHIASSATGVAFGGAISASDAGTLRITDSLFLLNSLQADSTKVYGGAISVGDSTKLELNASEGGLTMLMGNTVKSGDDPAQKQGIYLEDVSEMLIDAAQGGRVALLDPIEVNNSKPGAFTLNIQGAGHSYWGGHNVIDVATAGSSVNFTAGSTTYLQPDFQLENTGAGATSVNFQTGSKVELDLAGRDTSDPVFSNTGAGLTLTGTTELSIDYLGFDSSEGQSWQLYDPTDPNVNANGFNPTFGSASGMLAPFYNIDTTGKVTVDNSNMVNYLSANKNQSVRSVYNSGALASAWNNNFGATGSTTSAIEKATIFKDMAQNTASYLAEGAANSVISARTMLRGTGARALNLNRQSLKIANNSTGAQSLYASNGHDFFYSSHSSYPVFYSDAGSGFGDFAGLAKSYPRARVWGGYMFGNAEQKDSSGVSGYDADYTSIVLGASIDFSEYFSSGLYMTKMESDTDANNSALDTEGYSLGLLVGIYPGNFNIVLDVSGAYLTNDLQRRNLLSLYEADYDQYVFGGGVSVSYDLTVPMEILLTPFARYDYQFIKQETYKEGSQAMANKIKGLDATTHSASVGVSAARDFKLSELISFTPTASLAYRHEFGDTDVNATGSFANAAELFEINSIEAPTDFVDATLGLRFGAGPLALDASYKYSIGDDFSSHEGYVGLRWGF